MNNREVEQMVLRGGRLARPAASHIMCTDKIYDLMTRCWATHRDNRPTFSYLAGLFADYCTESEKQYEDETQEEDDDDDDDVVD